MKHAQKVYKTLLRPYTFFFGHHWHGNSDTDDTDGVPKRRDPATRLHFDLMCLVLDYLTMPSLLECASVNQTWSACIVFMPNFWDRMDMEMPFVSRSFAESVLFRKTSLFELKGPMMLDSLRSRLELLQHAGTAFSHGIALKSMELAWTAKILNDAMSYDTLVELSIVDCSIHVSQLRPVLATATHVTKLTIERISSPLFGSIFSTSSKAIMASKGRAWPKGVPIALKYFKLSLGKDRSHFQWALDTLLPPKAMEQCTHLEHLFLDSHDEVAHTRYMYEAAMAAKRLMSLVVAPDAEMPSNTVLPWQQNTLAAPGDLCLVLSDVLAKSSTQSVETDIRAILQKYHRSLALIHMEGGWPATPDVYFALGSMTGSSGVGHCGAAPRLRELRLSTEVGMCSWGEESAFVKGLVTLLKASPSLEALTLVGPKRIDAAGLVALARHCPNLRYLALASQHPIPVSGLLELSRIAKRLVVLQLSSYCDNLSDKTLADIVNNLPELTRVDLRQKKHTSEKDFSAAHELLGERGGYLYTF